jgi:hypothetical protein
MSKPSKPSPDNSKPTLDLDQLIHMILALDTLDRLKIWSASYCSPQLWVGYGLALDNGDPHPRFRCCAHFSLN